jgi:C_GCAxxG_C_C family probable redox protein
MESAERIRAAGESALEHFLRKRANCAEAVFLAVHEQVQSDLPASAAALATPFGGGVGIRGENCGALLGGMMGLGLVYGRANPEEGSLHDHRERLWESYALFNQLPHRFQVRFGTVQCWDLTEPHVYGTSACRARCEGIVAGTASMAMELLLEAQQNGLGFAFNKNLLSQASEATGLSTRELVQLKTLGRPFPPPEGRD